MHLTVKYTQHCIYFYTNIINTLLMSVRHDYILFTITTVNYGGY